MYPDASLATVHPSFGRYRDTFIHEMTHVWQFYHGYWVNIRALWAMTIGKGYSYTLNSDDAWDDFNVEQQAQIVEDWFANGMSPNDDRFVFIDKIIRPGVEGGFWSSIIDTVLMKMPLDKLRNLNL